MDYCIVTAITLCIGAISMIVRFFHEEEQEGEAEATEYCAPVLCLSARYSEELVAYQASLTKTHFHPWP